MWKLVKKVFRHCFTGPDNETYVLRNFLWAASVVAYLVYGFWMGAMGKAIDAMQYAIGLSTLLGGGGAGSCLAALSEKTSPSPYADLAPPLPPQKGPQ